MADTVTNSFGVAVVGASFVETGTPVCALRRAIARCTPARTLASVAPAPRMDTLKSGRTVSGEPPEFRETLTGSGINGSSAWQ